MTAGSFHHYDAIMIDKQTSAARLVEATAEKKSGDAPSSARAQAGDASGVVQSKPEVERGASGPPKSIMREYFESAVVTVIMALYGMTFIVQAVKVPTGSMQNTILVGDHLLVNKFIFAPGPHVPFLPQREIRRGDIIVFKYPGNKNNPSGDIEQNSPPFVTNYVKRVVGLPGERVEVKGASVFINGELLPEHRVFAEDGDQRAPLFIPYDKPLAANELYRTYWSSTPVHSSEASDEASVTVPPGHYFVMGDNRDNSADSRVWGFVPRDLVIGRAMFVYWSFDESADSKGNLLMDFLYHTRWSRTGTMIK